MTDVTLRPDPEIAEDDPFEAQAIAMFRMWASNSRELKRAREDIVDRDRDLAIANARIIELERTNSQLNDRISESMSREALAHAEAARLAGIMQVTGLSLADGMAKQRPAPAPSAFRPRTVP